MKVRLAPKEAAETLDPDLVGRLSRILPSFAFPMDSTTRFIHEYAAHEGDLMERAKLVADEDTSRDNIYTMDPTWGGYVKASGRGRLHALEGNPAGHCMLLAYKLANKLNHTKVPSFVALGMVPTAKTADFIAPGHAQTGFLSPQGVGEFDPTVSSNHGLMLNSSKIGDEEWERMKGSLPQSTKRQVHAQAEGIRKRTVEKSERETRYFRRLRRHSAPVGHEFDDMRDWEDIIREEGVRWVRNVAAMRDAIREAKRKHDVEPILSAYDGFKGSRAPKSLANAPWFAKFKDYNPRNELVGAVGGFLDGDEFSPQERDKALMKVIEKIDPFEEWDYIIPLLTPERLSRLSNRGLTDFIHTFGHDFMEKTLTSDKTLQDAFSAYSHAVKTACARKAELGITYDLKDGPKTLVAEHLLGDIACIYINMSGKDPRWPRNQQPDLLDSCTDLFISVADSIPNLHPPDWYLAHTDKTNPSTWGIPTWHSHFRSILASESRPRDWKPLIANAARRGRFSEWFTVDGEASPKLNATLSERMGEALASGNLDLLSEMDWWDNYGIRTDFGPYCERVTDALIDNARRSMASHPDRLFTNFPDGEHPISAIIEDFRYWGPVRTADKTVARKAADPERLRREWPAPPEEELAAKFASDLKVEDNGRHTSLELGSHGNVGLPKVIEALWEDNPPASEKTASALALHKVMGAGGLDWAFHKWRSDYPMSWGKFSAKLLPTTLYGRLSVGMLFRSLEKAAAREKLGFTQEDMKDNSRKNAVKSEANSAYFNGLMAYAQACAVTEKEAAGHDVKELSRQKREQANEAVKSACAIPCEVYSDDSRIKAELDERTSKVFAGTDLDGLTPKQKQIFFLKLAAMKAIGGELEGNHSWSPSMVSAMMSGEAPTPMKTRKAAVWRMLLESSVEKGIQTNFGTLTYNSAHWMGCVREEVEGVELNALPHMRRNFRNFLLSESGRRLSMATSGDFDSFREFRPGEDDPRRIDAKASARTDRKLVRVYRERENQPLEFHVDVEWLGQQRPDELEYDPPSNVSRLVRLLLAAENDELNPTLKLYLRGSLVEEYDKRKLKAALEHRKSEGGKYPDEEFFKRLWKLACTNYEEEMWHMISVLLPQSMAKDELLQPKRDTVAVVAVNKEDLIPTSEQFRTMDGKNRCRVHLISDR